VIRLQGFPGVDAQSPADPAAEDLDLASALDAVHPALS
jgi:hypothetical protein